MEQLIAVNYDTQTVSARDLHEKLGATERFNSWFERNSSYLINGEDYTTVKVLTEVQNNGGIQKRELDDYDLTIDAAKQICMIQRSEKGKLYRQYFLDLEKAWNTPEQVMARALRLADKTIDGLKQQVIEMKPKALFADAVAASNTSILIGDLAKLLKQNGIDTGQKRLFDWLRNQGYLIKGGASKNMPTQRSMEQGLFEVKEGSYVDSNGCNVTTKTTKVTGKGQQYFINKFLGNEIVSA